jgi:hypothetical protein
MASVPTTNITDSAIISAVNAGGGSAGNVMDAFSKSAKCDIFARFKPTIKTDILFHTPADTSNGWWRADNGSCGINLPICYNLQDVRGKDFSTEWTHDAPYEAGAPCRFDDFGGYNTEARHPISSLRRSGQDGWDVVYFDRTDYEIIGVYCTFYDNRVGKTQDNDALDITDIAFRNGGQFLGDLYYGLIFSKDNSTFCSYITMEKTLNQLISAVEKGSPTQEDRNNYPYVGGIMNIYAPTAVLRNKEGDLYQGDGAYTIYPCLFVDANPHGTAYGDVRGSQSNISLASGFVPLPVKPIHINVLRKTSYIKIDFVSAVRNASVSNTNGTALDVTLRFTNNDQKTPYTFSDGVGTSFVRVGVGKHYEYSSIPNYAYSASQGADFTLPAGGTVTRTFTTAYTTNVPYSDGRALVAYRVQFVGETIARDGFISSSWK